MEIIKNTMVEPINRTCDNCESVIGFTFDEMKIETGYNLYGVKYEARHIICPVCGYKIDLGIRCREGEEE